MKKVMFLVVLFLLFSCKKEDKAKHSKKVDKTTRVCREVPRNIEKTITALEVYKTNHGVYPRSYKEMGMEKPQSEYFDYSIISVGEGLQSDVKVILIKGLPGLTRMAFINAQVDGTIFYSHKVMKKYMPQYLSSSEAVCLNKTYAFD